MEYRRPEPPTVLDGSTTSKYCPYLLDRDAIAVTCKIVDVNIIENYISSRRRGLDFSILKREKKNTTGKSPFLRLII